MLRTFAICAVAWGFLLSAALGAAPASASDGEIRIRFDDGDDDDDCQATIGCGGHERLFVYVVLAGATSNGITGVEYGMRFNTDGAPDGGWTFAEDFTRGATIALGSGSFVPPDEHVFQPRRNRGRGANVAWAECQRGDDARILLETVEVMNTGCDPAPLHVLVQDHDRPSNQFFRCPLATLCDPPTFTKVCLGNNVTPCVNLEGPRGDPALCSTSGSVVINAPSPIANPCIPTAVRQEAWTGVKGLYR